MTQSGAVQLVAIRNAAAFPILPSGAQLTNLEVVFLPPNGKSVVPRIIWKSAVPIRGGEGIPHHRSARNVPTGLAPRKTRDFRAGVRSRGGFGGIPPNALPTTVGCCQEDGGLFRSSLGGIPPTPRN